MPRKKSTIRVTRRRSTEKSTIRVARGRSTESRVGDKTSSLNTEPSSSFDATDHMVAILQEVFPDYKWDDHVLRTAERFIGFLEEYAPRTEPDFAFTTFPAISKSQVVVGDVEFASICKHHLLPFMGKAYVGYIPNNVVVGVSKVPRLIEFFAKRPQTQEELTHQIAEYLNKWLDPVAVAVVMKASHTCMGARGIRKVGAEMTTSVLLGNYLHVPAARDEFFRLAGL